MRFLILILFFIIGCKSLKETTKTDNTKQTTTIERKTVTRPGDTITINIPNIRYKDTVIQRINYENKTVARVTYDTKGNQKFECLSAEFLQELELIRQEIKNDIKEIKEVKREFNPQYFIYSLIGLGIVFIFGFGLVYFMFNKLQVNITSLISEVVKK